MQQRPAPCSARNNGRTTQRYTTLFRSELKSPLAAVVCIEDSEDEGDDMSEISNLSREALLELICKQKNNKMGSYPQNNHDKSHSMPSEIGDEESSSDSSASNSSLN